MFSDVRETDIDSITITFLDISSISVCECVTFLSFPGNGSVDMFLQQWSNVGGIVFYTVHVVFIEKKNRRIVLARTSCFILCILCTMCINWRYAREALAICFNLRTPEWILMEFYVISLYKKSYNQFCFHKIWQPGNILPQESKWNNW